MSAKTLDLERLWWEQGHTGGPLPPHYLPRGMVPLELRRVGQPHVFFTGTREGVWHVSLVEPELIVQKLGGPRVLLAFAKCFSGANQILTFEQSIKLTREHLGYDTPAGARNLHTLAMCLVATMYEVAEALNQLLNVPIVPMLSRPELWDPLNAIRKEWYGHALAKKVRVHLAFHLGDKDVYDKGWDAAIENNPYHCPVFTSGREPRLGMHFRGATDLLIRGMELEDKDFKALVQRSVHGHSHFPIQVYDLFFDVLNTAGIPADDQRIG